MNSPTLRYILIILAVCALDEHLAALRFSQRLSRFIVVCNGSAPRLHRVDLGQMLAPWKTGRVCIQSTFAGPSCPVRFSFHSPYFPIQFRLLVFPSGVMASPVSQNKQDASQDTLNVRGAVPRAEQEWQARRGYRIITPAARPRKAKRVSPGHLTREHKALEGSRKDCREDLATVLARCEVWLF